MSKWWKKQYEVAGWWKEESYKQNEYAEAATKVEPSSMLAEPKVEYDTRQPYEPYRPYVQPEPVPWTSLPDPPGLESDRKLRSALEGMIESASYEIKPLEPKEKTEAKEKSEYVNYW